MVKVKITDAEFRQRLRWTLNQKIDHALGTIEQYYNWYDGKVYVAFSGGKDSTVLLWLARKLFPRMKAVFIDTGLEYPEVRDFVKTIHNVTWLKPKLTFGKVLDKYGYPVVSKDQSDKIRKYRCSKSEIYKEQLLGDGTAAISRKWQHLIDAPFKISEQCCDVMKKKPAKLFEKKTMLRPIIGTMATESRQRKLLYLLHGCNSFHTLRAYSRPLSIWTEDNIWEIIRRENIKYSEIYNMGYERTGCMFCMFGIEYDGTPNRFQKMEVSHPKLHNYCINKLGLGEILTHLNVPYTNDI